jgi:membrane protease YdiL (CAAX protease family)
MQNDETHPAADGQQATPLSPRRQDDYELRSDTRDNGTEGISTSSPFGDVPLAETVRPRPSRPRVFVAVLVGILVIPTAMVLSGIVLVMAGLLNSGPEIFRPDPAFLKGEAGLPSWLIQLVHTRLGLFVMILPGQLVFLGVTIGAAALSPEPFARRLALRRGVLPLWTWGVLIAATPLIGLGSSMLLSLVVSDASEQLKLMTDMMQTHAKSFLPGLLVLVAIVPGLVEELLFRGYLQSRLLKSWPALGAISLSAVIFAAAHLDPIHVLGVLPLGIWLGIVAWRADSVWPAMLCHAVNNAAAVLGVMYGTPDTMAITFDPVTVTTLAVSGPAFLISLLIFCFAPPAASRLDGKLPA